MNLCYKKQWKMLIEKIKSKDVFVKIYTIYTILQYADVELILKNERRRRLCKIVQKKNFPLLLQSQF